MKWVVRVYGLLRDEKGRYLVLEEYFRDGWITKFPGGGVEAHEGLLDALSREMREELGVTVRKAEHFYTTHFYQRSFYHAEARLLAVYYRVWWEGEIRLTSPQMQSFWLFPELMMLTFPVDRYVQRLLMGEEPAESLPNGFSSTGPGDCLLARPCSWKRG